MPPPTLNSEEPLIVWLLVLNQVLKHSCTGKFC